MGWWITLRPSDPSGHRLHGGAWWPLMPCTCLRVSLIGCGCLGRTRTFSCRAQAPILSSRRPTGRWCQSLRRPRRFLPAEDTTVALYMQHVADTAKSYATVKSASAAIAFFQKINLFNHLPTHAPEVCMVRLTPQRCAWCDRLLQGDVCHAAP